MSDTPWAVKFKQWVHPSKRPIHPILQQQGCRFPVFGSMGEFVKFERPYTYRCPACVVTDKADVFKGCKFIGSFDEVKTHIETCNKAKKVNA